MAENDPKPAEDKEVTTKEKSSPEEGGSPSKPSFFKRYLPVLIVAGIVFVECIVVFFVVPSGELRAEGDLTPEQIEMLQKASSTDTEPIEEEVPCVEVDMGDQMVAQSSQAKGETIQVTFHLYGVVSEEDKEEFKTFFKGQENRIRDDIRSIVRKTKISDLSDPSLGLIKNQILETVNRRFGRPILREVVFSDYSFLER